MGESFHITIWLLPSVAALFLALAGATYARTRPEVAGSGALVALLLAIAAWSIAQTFEVSLTSASGKIWAAKLQYPGIASAPVLWLMFGLQYSGRGGWLSGLTRTLVWTPALLSVAVVLTNDSHGLMWSALALVTGDAYVALSVEHGPYFVFHVVYSYCLVAAGTALLAWTLAQAGRRWRQLAAVLAAPALVAGANLLYLSPFYPAQWLDLTPLAFAVAGCVLCWGLLRPGRLDRRPIARSDVVDRIPDAVFVLDDRGRILDLNPAAASVLGEHAGSPVGRPFAELLDAPVLGGPQLESGGEVRDLPLRRSGEERTYDVRISLLKGARRSVGRVLVFRETTDRRRIEQGLREASASLELANRELERLANTDTLTGLSNRRHFTATLEAELRRALRHERPLSLIVLDLDRFKQVNDQHGHAMGDRVLVSSARAIEDVVREVDLVGRLGGEEFAVLVPETDLSGAFRLAERIRANIAASGVVDSRGEPLRVTASLGVAALGVSGSDADSLLLAADDALYRAKANGRNRAERADEPTRATRLGS